MTIVLWSRVKTVISGGSQIQNQLKSNVIPVSSTMLIISKTTNLFNFNMTKKKLPFELKLIKVSFSPTSRIQRFDWPRGSRAPPRMNQFVNPLTVGYQYFLSLSKWFKLSFIFQCPFNFGFHQFGLVEIMPNGYREFWLDHFYSYWSNWMQILHWWSYLVTFGSTSIFGKRRMEHQ